MVIIMILVKETFNNTDGKFRVTNFAIEYKRQKMPSTNSYPAHIHDSFIEFEIVHNGQMIQIINGIKYKLTKGSVVILKPTDCHSLEWSDDADINTVHFLASSVSKELIYSIMQHEENIVYSFSGDDEKNILTSSEQLLLEYEKNQHFCENIIKNLIENICYLTMRNIKTFPFKEKKLTPIQKAVTALQTTFMNNPSLEDIASYVHFNPSYFSRVFKKATGTSFSQYLIDLKLEYAKKLLCETNMTIADICFGSGFGSLSNFSKYFKTKFKMSPNDMRKKHGKTKLEFYSEKSTKTIL